MGQFVFYLHCSSVLRELDIKFSKWCSEAGTHFFLGGLVLVQIPNYDGIIVFKI